MNAVTNLLLPAQLTYLGNASASPQMEKFTGAQAGQSVCYWLRWVSTRGEKAPLVGPKHGEGSWSEPITATIAG